jgi:PilZ domain
VTHNADRSADERRQFSRIDFEADAILIQDGESLSAQLEDISLNGVLISTPTQYQLRADRPCTLRVSLAGNAVIEMQIILVHSSSTFLGFHCVSIDMDSVVHLRRLIEMNLDDADASERVLAELLKRHQPRS